VARCDELEADSRPFSLVLKFNYGIGECFPVVLEVQRKVVVRVRVAGCHIRQELAAAEVAEAATQVEVPIQLIPGVAIDFSPHMAAVVGLVGHDRTA